MILGVLLVAVALVTVYHFLVHPAFVSPLAKVPAAHWSCHISPVWLVYQRWAGQENKIVYELHEKKGPIMRIRPNELSINCVEEGTRTIYGSNFEKDKFFSLSFQHYG